ncbi:MAG: hypothetical protein AAB265_04300, partial [candidate division NC10 bacterium]
MPPVPMSEWGRRLSDAIREALARGDLASARRLALEGDGQARSLEKEYALMYKGLGITIRVLLGQLRDLSARGDLAALLDRFRRDMAALAAEAYPSPGARGAVQAIRPSAAVSPGERIEAALDRTGRFVSAAEEVFAREQSRLAAEAVRALEAGDAARARACVDEKEQRQYVPLHDRLIFFMAEVFGHVLAELGPDGLHRFHLGSAEGQRQGFEGWERMGAAAFARASAFLLKQHMGGVEVREDEEKFTFVQSLCGSGGRLQLRGAYTGPGALPFVPGPAAVTAGEERLPVYCSHCPIWNGVASIEWFG